MMRERLFGRRTGGGIHEPDADTAGITDRESSARRNPVRWLIAGGALLIAAIVIGITMMVGNFRERALASSERELENTVLLLARHFDQQLEDAGIIQNSLVEYVYAAGIASPDIQSLVSFEPEFGPLAVEPQSSR